MTETITTGADLPFLADRHGPHIEGGRTCPGCCEDLSRIGIPSLAYTFVSCACPAAGYVHLVEQLWHLDCLKSAS